MKAAVQRWSDAQARAATPGSSVLRSWLASRPGAHERATQLQASSKYQLSDRPAMAEIFQLPSSGAGPAVTPTTAMQVTAVYACISLIAGAIASLPLAFFERLDGDKRRRIKHDLWWLFNEQPSPLLPAAVFWEYVIATRYLNRDGFALIVRDRNNKITELLPLSPLWVEPRRVDRNTLVYVVVPDGDIPGLEPFAVHQDDMLHFFGFGFNGRRSMSVIQQVARQAISTQLAQDEFSGRFFGQGAQPSFVIKYPGPVSTETIDQLRMRWAERQAGLANAHKPLVLTHNGDVKELTIDPVDAQLLESKRFGVEDIARAFGVPPHMIGSSEKVTSWGSGVESMGQGFVRFTLMRELRRIEQELNRKCFRTATYFCEFVVDALQRGDLKARGDYYRQARGGSQGPGWMTANEIRELENFEPITGGDKLYEAVAPAAPAPKPSE
jgi:HK97 family phage portal protein